MPTTMTLTDNADVVRELPEISGNSTLASEQGLSQYPILFAYDGYDETSNSQTVSFLHNADHFIEGLLGDDDINAGYGQDQVYGGGGNDTLYGGYSNSTQDLLEISRRYFRTVYDQQIQNVYDAETDTYSQQIVNVPQTVDLAQLVYTEEHSVLLLGGDDFLNGGEGNDVLDGDDGDDQLVGEMGQDTIYGGSSAVINMVDNTYYLIDALNPDVNTFSHSVYFSQDVVVAGGNDWISGGEGDDLLYGGDGDDTIYGDEGDDYLDGGTLSLLIVRERQQDTVVSESLIETSIIESTRIVMSDSGGDILYGGTGDDNIRVSGGKGKDVAYGGIGNDFIGADYNQTWNEVVQTKTETNQYNFSTQQNSSTLVEYTSEQTRIVIGHDVFYGELGDDQLDGGNGDDQLYGGDGFDRLNGGQGLTFYNNFFEKNVQRDDVTNITTEDFSFQEVYISGGDDLIDGGSDNDEIDGRDGHDRLFGGSGDDYIYGGLGGVQNLNFNYYLRQIDGNGNITTLEEGSGYQQIYISGGDDTLYGGDGTDTLWGDDGHDQLYGGAGNDALYGGGGGTYELSAQDDLGVITTTTLIVEGGDDQLYGGAGNDLLDGYDGNDRLDGGVGADTMQGGTGNDTYVRNSNLDVIVELEGQGIDTVESSLSYTLINHLEHLTLTGTQVAVGRGNSLDNTLTANNAGNQLYGVAGNDTLIGGAGADLLDGGVGADTMRGGLGNDTYVRNSSGDVIVELANQGTDTVLSSLSMILGDHLENLTLTGGTTANATGNSLANTVLGNGAANVLDGRAGNDVLNGGLGNDRYVFKRGYAQDVVVDQDLTVGNQDQLSFGSLIDVDQLWLSQVGNDLQVSIIGTLDQVLVQGWYSSSANQVEQLVLSSGSTLLSSNVQQLVNAMAGMTPPALGQTELSAAQHAQLDAVIAASWV